MSISIEEKERDRVERYEPFRRILKDGETRLGIPPERWWRSSVMFLEHTQKKLGRSPADYPMPIQEFFGTYGTKVLEVLKCEAKSGDTDHDLAARAVMVMHKISDVLMADETIDHEQRTISHLSLEEICTRSARFKLVETHGAATNCRFLSIMSDKRNSWHNYPLPRTNKVLHKGGVGRTILKILAGANPNTIESELPPNDFDYLVIKDSEGFRDARELGADPDGIEAVDGFDLQELMNNRDLDINNAFIGRDGIYFATDAFEAARTGKIAIVSTKRGIYGSEVFYHDGDRILKNRGIMRLLKTVAESKALSFDFLPVNRQVNLGIYWLVLAKRFERKDQFPVIMDRLFVLGSQIGQVPEGASSVIDVLEAVHTRYPFYDIDGAPLDGVGVARWLGKKLMRQIDKKYRDVMDIPSMMPLIRQPGDTVPYEVNLDGYIADSRRLEDMKKEWVNFIERCRRRTADHVKSLQGEEYVDDDPEE